MVYKYSQAIEPQKEAKIKQITMYPPEAYETYDKIKESIPENAIAICKKDGDYYATIGQQG